MWETIFHPKVNGDAYKSEYFLQCGIIIFQVVEFLLRLRIYDLMEKRNLSDWAKEKVEEEQRFFKLTFYLDLMQPNNDVSRRLRNLNTKRNNMIHDLLGFESGSSLKKELKDFYSEGLKLMNILRESTFDKYLMKKGGKMY